MGWVTNTCEPIERYIFEGGRVRIGRYDCPSTHPAFGCTEAVLDDMFVLATRAIWMRRNTRHFHYVGPGALVMHGAGATIERRRDADSHDLAYWFAIQPDLFEEALVTMTGRPNLPRYGSTPDARLQLEIALLLRNVERGEVDALVIESNVLSLLGAVCNAFGCSGDAHNDFLSRADARRRARQRVDAARSFIDRNLGESIDLQDLSRAVGVSAFHLCRLFKAVTGITIHEYRIRQRLAIVVDKLTRDRDGDLTELALDTGFSSHSHLSSTFARHVGLPPSRVRELVATTDGHRNSGTASTL